MFKELSAVSVFLLAAGVANAGAPGNYHLPLRASDFESKFDGQVAELSATVLDRKFLREQGFDAVTVTFKCEKGQTPSLIIVAQKTTGPTSSVTPRTVTGPTTLLSAGEPVLAKEVALGESEGNLALFLGTDTDSILKMAKTLYDAKSIRLTVDDKDFKTKNIGLSTVSVTEFNDRRGMADFLLSCPLIY